MSKSKKRGHHSTSGTQSTVTKGKLIEAIVASMHEGNDVTVERNVKLTPIGGSQAPMREIDVLLSSHVCGYPARWAIECKNYKKRIGAPFIDQFVGKLQDVGIPPQFGIFVTTSDYSKGAIEQAKKVGIRLLLIKDGLRDLGLDIQHAIQTTVFLLPVVNGITIQNFAFTPMSSFEAVILFNKQGEAVHSIPDSIWFAWVSGHIQPVLGEHEIELDMSDELYQRIEGKLTRVIKIVVQVKILGLMQQFTGTTLLHHLQNATTHLIEKQQLKTNFPPPIPGSYLLKPIQTEEQLEQEMHAPTIVAITSRICLPRINFWNAFYWPPSERVAKIVNEQMQAFEAGLIPDPRPFNISELEGSDLTTIFEQISSLHPAGQMTSEGNSMGKEQGQEASQ